MPKDYYKKSTEYPANSDLNRSIPTADHKTGKGTGVKDVLDAGGTNFPKENAKAGTASPFRGVYGETKG